jgi:succinate dehydrogenase/fumarate reductase flavoprotein subunit
MLKEASRKLSCDILVVGAGLAGLRAAYDCARAGLSVILAAKGKLCSGSSFYPLTGGLGSQLPLDEADKAQFLAELLDSGGDSGRKTLRHHG